MCLRTFHKKGIKLLSLGSCPNLAKILAMAGFVLYPQNVEAVMFSSEVQISHPLEIIVALSRTFSKPASTHGPLNEKTKCIN